MFHRFLMKHGGKIGTKVTMRKRQRNQAHESVLLKAKRLGHHNKLGNGWKEFKTINVDFDGFVTNTITNMGYAIRVS